MTVEMQLLADHELPDRQTRISTRRRRYLLRHGITCLINFRFLRAHNQHSSAVRPRSITAVSGRTGR